MGDQMAKNDHQFTGGIPGNYDSGLGPFLFQDFAVEMAGRAAALAPMSVLEIAAGTGIVSRSEAHRPTCGGALAREWSEHR